MQEKKRDLAGKIALAELTFLEQKRGTAETDDEKRKREEWEKEKEKIKDTLEWEIEKSEFAKRWEANELDRLHYLALVGDAAALAARIEERKREYLAEQEQKNQAEKKKAALQSAMKDKMEVDSAKKKEEDDKQGMANVPHARTAHARTAHTDTLTAHALSRAEAEEIQDGPLDVRLKDGLTPLHLAAFAGNLECLILLLDSGATLGVKDIQKRTAFHWYRSPLLRPRPACASDTVCVVCVVQCAGLRCEDTMMCSSCSSTDSSRRQLVLDIAHGSLPGRIRTDLRSLFYERCSVHGRQCRRRRR